MGPAGTAPLRQAPPPPGLTSPATLRSSLGGESIPHVPSFTKKPPLFGHCVIFSQKIPLWRAAWKTSHSVGGGEMRAPTRAEPGAPCWPLGGPPQRSPVSGWSEAETEEADWDPWNLSLERRGHGLPLEMRKLRLKDALVLGGRAGGGGSTHLACFSQAAPGLVCFSRSEPSWGSADLRGEGGM